MSASTDWEDAYRVQTARVEELRRENAALRKDKDRLDSGMIRLRAFSEWGNGWCVHSGIDLRAAIDAARAKEGQP